MPLREEGAPKSFTWITGNPRSKKNITQIRRHAGQNSGVKSEHAPRAHSTSSPRPGHRGSPKHFRTVYPSSKGEEAAERLPHVQRQLNDLFSSSDSSTALGFTAAPTNTSRYEPTNAFQQIYPLASSSAERPTSGDDGTPSRKVAIWDLVNHSAEEEERHRLEVLASTPGQESDDSRGEYFGGNANHEEFSHAMSEVRTRPPRDSRWSSPTAASTVLQANIARRRKPAVVAPAPHVPWRIGMAPSATMTLSKEDSQVEQILLQTSTFYKGKFESSWSAQLRESLSYFDVISETENFSGSVTTAAGLLAVGRVDTASSILSRVLPTLSTLLTSQHPQLYYVLAELSLDTSDTELGRLRSQVKNFAAAASRTILGSSHPITKLLQLNLSNANQRLRLRELIQRRIHELHEQLFTATSYQTTGQYYYLARVLSQLGQVDEAARILARILPIWEETYGPDSLMPVTGLLEMTKVHLASNDVSLDTESLISDALRRTMNMEKAATPSDDSAPPQRPISAGLVHSRMGCLRTLGRLHLMRGNVETAMMQYTAAVNVGVEELGANVPAVQLALADLDAVGRIAAQPEVYDGRSEGHVWREKESSGEVDGVAVPVRTVRVGPRVGDLARVKLSALSSINNTAVL